MCAAAWTIVRFGWRGWWPRGAGPRQDVAAVRRGVPRVGCTPDGASWNTAGSSGRRTIRCRSGRRSSAVRPVAEPACGRPTCRTLREFHRDSRPFAAAVVSEARGAGVAQSVATVPGRRDVFFLARMTLTSTTPRAIASSAARPARPPSTSAATLRERLQQAALAEQTHPTRPGLLGRLLRELGHGRRQRSVHTLPGSRPGRPRNGLHRSRPGRRNRHIGHRILPLLRVYTEPLRVPRCRVGTSSAVAAPLPGAAGR
ncbi:hypothetical protein EHYA_04776 [Embleya hyalina]|uniref:Uncharacterized protein n=1 Tax=Embleya hyalina TaxID=516124 RepID=A0A401YR62_9ACTN|nr:hypothetical protein EHYA_04776 [Embleya hyalina]